jgi:5-methylcytosine-specific restriction endonuclease McrA
LMRDIDTRKWRRLRKRKLEANPHCELRLPSCKRVASQIDHKVARAKGGDP